ncbi:MAG: PAS domain-containing protein [Methylococcaceae bacterium]
MFEQDYLSTLRKDAEIKLASLSSQKDSVLHDLQNWLTKKYADEVMHELQIHQIELELQNEELRQTQVLLEESRDRYFDLYEFAPIGYFTLTMEGVISSCNLTGAELFNISDRAKLVNRRFASYVMSEDVERWNLYFLRVKQHNEQKNQHIELKIKRPNKTFFQARLDTKLDTQKQVRVALSNLIELL